MSTLGSTTRNSELSMMDFVKEAMRSQQQVQSRQAPSNTLFADRDYSQQGKQEQPSFSDQVRDSPGQGPNVANPFTFLKQAETVDQVGYQKKDPVKEARLQKIAKGQGIGKSLAMMFNSALIGTDNDIATPQGDGQNTLDQLQYMDNEERASWQEAFRVATQGKAENIDNANQASLESFRRQNNADLRANELAARQAETEGDRAFRSGEGDKNRAFDAEQSALAREEDSRQASLNRNSKTSGKGKPKYKIEESTKRAIQKRKDDIDAQLNDPEFIGDPEALISQKEALNIEGYDPDSNALDASLQAEGLEMERQGLIMEAKQSQINTTFKGYLDNGSISDAEERAFLGLIKDTFSVEDEQAVGIFEQMKRDNNIGEAEAGKEEGQEVEGNAIKSILAERESDNNIVRKSKAAIQSKKESEINTLNRNAAIFLNLNKSELQRMSNMSTLKQADDILKKLVESEDKSPGKLRASTRPMMGGFSGWDAPKDTLEKDQYIKELKELITQYHNPDQ